MDTKSTLKPGTLLRDGTYRVEASIASGGFGKTYRVRNVVFNEVYALKEFYLHGVNTRQDNNMVTVSVPDNQDTFDEQKAKFRKEAQRLRSLSNPHIVKVHDLFEENGTTYYVMDFIDGQSLSDRLKTTGQPMSEAEVRRILPQLLSALKTVHSQQIWHLDIKPSNIMVDKKGNAYLIDFGASKQIGINGNMTLSALSLTPYFAPVEQTGQNSKKFGPWTDIYALGATLYNLLTNQTPPASDDILKGPSAFHFPPTVSSQMQSLICWMMKVNSEDRPQQVADIERFLSGAPADGETVISSPMKPKSSLKPIIIPAALLGIILIGACVCFLLFPSDKKSSHTDSYYEDDSDDTELPEKSSKLRELAQAANEYCPMDMGNFGTATSITYDENDNAIVYSFNVNEDIVDLEALATNRVRMKDNVLTMISNPNDNMRKLMETIIEENGKLRYIYHGTTSGLTTRATLTSTELNDAMNTYVSPRQKVKANVDTANLQTPVQVDEETVLTGIKIEGDDVVYEYELEESEDLNVAILKANQANMKEMLEKVAYNNDDMAEKQFMDQVIDADMNLCYRYHGNTSGDYVEIRFTTSELRARLR